MHPHSTAEAATLASAHYGIYMELFHVAEGAGTNWFSGGLQTQVRAVLGYDPLLSARITADLDQPVMSAEFRLHLGTGTKSLSPLYGAGAKVNGRPLLDPGHRVRLNIKCVPSGAAVGSPAGAAVPWRPIFEGWIDAVDPAEGNDEVVVRCRDLYSVYLDTWIEPGPAGGWPVSGQQIGFHLSDLVVLLDDSTGWVPNSTNRHYATLFLHTQGSPTLSILPYNVQPGSCLMLMREAALQNGWDLRGKYGPGGSYDNDTYVLTYYEPNRTLANPYVVTPGRYFELGGLIKDRTEVRNVVEVVPADPPRTPIKLVDATSVAKYGRRYLGISEDATSNIRNATQGTALATAILSDTKEPKVGGVVTRLLHPFLEINDVISLSPNNVHHDSPLVLAISGLEHNLTNDGHGETVVRTRNIPAAANKEWREKQDPKLLYTGNGTPNFRAAEGAEYLQLDG